MISGACFAGMTLALSGAAQAEPGFARLYKQQYGYAPSCHACHKDGGGTPVNAYGQQFKDAGKSLAAFAKIAGKDADGDGAANEAESKAKANPGQKGSTPASPGSWLDTASLIPREVQAAFPGVRSYLPRDALLTDADIARAKGMGAELSKADENTIYIPVENQKPVGTAIIFPARHQGKDFFLLLATDRQLNVTRVEPLHASKVPEARTSKVYASFKGVAVDKLPAAQGEGLDAAITRAVKKAGTLLYVRLKSA
jgi:hypothetical protein